MNSKIQRNILEWKNNIKKSSFCFSSVPIYQHFAVNLMKDM